ARSYPRHFTFYIAGPTRSIHSSYFLILPFFCADHSHCTAPFCSVRSGWSGLAFACLALPCRYCAPASTTVGRQSECVGDQLFGSFLSLVHLAAFLLGRVSVSIRPDWD